MADLTITGTVTHVAPASAGQGLTPSMVLVGETVGQGQPLYFDETANNYKKAKNTNAVESKVACITVGEALANQYVPVMSGRGGKIDFDTTAGLVVSMQYVLSENYGKIKAYCELNPGEYSVPLFWVDTDGNAVLNIEWIGVARTTTTTTTTTT